MKVCGAVLAALAWAAVAADAHAAVSIRGIHSSAGEGYSRVVIDLSASTRFQYGFVPAAGDKPARVYVDVHDVVLDDQRGQVVSIGDGRITRVRTGQYQARVARIVLEVESAVSPKVLAVEDPPRIVVDLAGPARIAPVPPQIGADTKKVTAPAEREAKTPGATAQASTQSPTASAGAPAGGRTLARSARSPARPTDPRAAASTHAVAARPPQTTSPQQSTAMSPPLSAGRGTGLAPIQSSARATMPAQGARPQSSNAARPGAPQQVAARPVPNAGAGLPPSASAPVSPGRGTGLRVIPPRVLSDPSRKAKPIRVVIDAGHGGKDPGAKGPAGYEKDLVLDIAKRLAAKLTGELQVEVHMTRNSDVYVPLDQRKDVANRIEADMFISIHANASRNSKLFGIETYYLKNTNDRATLRLARLENGVDMLIKGSDVSTDADLNYILSDIIQGQKEADSILLANHIQGQLCNHLDRTYDSIRNIGVKQGPFLVLDGTYMPAVLVEAGFITNGAEGRRLGAASYQQAVAEGIFRGIKAYLEDDRVNDLI
jgi:N-acetylmuramoyl-L-alanine amidase